MTLDTGSNGQTAHYGAQEFAANVLQLYDVSVTAREFIYFLYLDVYKLELSRPFHALQCWPSGKGAASFYPGPTLSFTVDVVSTRPSSPNSFSAWSVQFCLVTRQSLIIRGRPFPFSYTEVDCCSVVGAAVFTE